MFRAIILLIFRSTRLCVTACGIMHPLCCRSLNWRPRLGASVQSTTGSRGMRISGSNVGYTMCPRYCEEYWLPIPFASFPFTSPPVCHCVSSHFNWSLPTVDRWLFTDDIEMPLGPVVKSEAVPLGFLGLLDAWEWDWHSLQQRQ